MAAKTEKAERQVTVPPGGAPEELVAAARDRAAQPLEPKELTGELAAGALFLAAALLLLLAAPAEPQIVLAGGSSRNMGTMASWVGTV